MQTEHRSILACSAVVADVFVGVGGVIDPHTKSSSVYHSLSRSKPQWHEYGPKK